MVRLRGQMPEVHEKLWQHLEAGKNNSQHHSPTTSRAKNDIKLSTYEQKLVKVSKCDLSSGQVNYSMSHCPILNHPKNIFHSIHTNSSCIWFTMHDHGTEASSPCFTTTSPESYAHLSKLRITRSLARRTWCVSEACETCEHNTRSQVIPLKRKNEVNSLVTTWPVFRVLVFLHQKIDFLLFFGRLQVGNVILNSYHPWLLSFHLIILQILEQENVAQHTLDFIHPHDVTEVASGTSWQEVGNLVQYQINVDIVLGMIRSESVK